MWSFLIHPTGPLTTSCGAKLVILLMYSNTVEYVHCHIQDI
jgi:hypothetical protein